MGSFWYVFHDIMIVRFIKMSRAVFLSSRRRLRFTLHLHLKFSFFLTQMLYLYSRLPFRYHQTHRSISSTDQCPLDICTNIQLLGISFSSFLFSFSFLFFFTIAIPIRPIQSLFFLSLYLLSILVVYHTSPPRFAVSSAHFTIHISIL